MGQGADRFRSEQAGRTGQRAGTQKVELSPELQRAQRSGPLVGLSLEMPERARRSALGSVRQAEPTKNEKAKNSKRRLSSKRHNSRRQAWMATNEPLEPVWKGKGTR